MVLLLKRFLGLWDNIYQCVCPCYCCHINAVKLCWVSQDDMCLLTYIFLVIFDGKLRDCVACFTEGITSGEKYRSFATTVPTNPVECAWELPIRTFPQFFHANAEAAVQSRRPLSSIPSLIFYVYSSTPFGTNCLRSLHTGVKRSYLFQVLLVLILSPDTINSLSRSLNGASDVCKVDKLDVPDTILRHVHFNSDTIISFFICVHLQNYS
jgi:hypothetical protein